mgnify:CR=1 FL=1
MLDIARARIDLLTVFQAGLARVDGRECVKETLKTLQGNISLVAIGKAAQAMTQGAVDVLGHRVVDGLVISKPGHLDLDWLASKGLKGLQGGHPVPNASSLVAG